MPVRRPESKAEDVADEVQHARVYYEKSITKNLGDYNSAKITVGVELPIDITKETKAKVIKTIEIADDIVSEELEIQVDSLLKEVDRD